jgi:predicted glycosyltransferase
VRRYNGIKEDVYLADFQPDLGFEKHLSKLGITGNDILVTVRPPASEALYHRFENALFDQLLERLLATPSVRVVLLPRNDFQRTAYSVRGNSNLILPANPMDGGNLIAYSDLVVSGGGTMNREAAALGIPAASIYLGEWAAIDEELVKEKRLQRISNSEDVRDLPIQKKGPTSARRAVNVCTEVADLILED